MKKINSTIFQNKSWGTNTVLQDTVLDLAQEQVQLLEERNDVDEYKDIKDISIFQQFYKPVNNDQIH